MSSTFPRLTKPEHHPARDSSSTKAKFKRSRDKLDLENIACHAPLLQSPEVSQCAKGTDKSRRKETHFNVMTSNVSQIIWLHHLCSFYHGTHFKGPCPWFIGSQNNNILCRLCNHPLFRLRDFLHARHWVKNLYTSSPLVLTGQMWGLSPLHIWKKWSLRETVTCSSEYFYLNIHSPLFQPTVSPFSLWKGLSYSPPCGVSGSLLA